MTNIPFKPCALLKIDSHVSRVKRILSTYALVYPLSRLTINRGWLADTQNPRKYLKLDFSLRPEHVVRTVWARDL